MFIWHCLCSYAAYLGRSVGIVHPRTKVTVLLYCYAGYIEIYSLFHPKYVCIVGPRHVCKGTLCMILFLTDNALWPTLLTSKKN
jgi:hypothetical protein